MVKSADMLEKEISYNVLYTDTIPPMLEYAFCYLISHLFPLVTRRQSLAAR